MPSLFSIKWIPFGVLMFDKGFFISHSILCSCAGGVAPAGMEAIAVGREEALQAPFILSSLEK